MKWLPFRSRKAAQEVKSPHIASDLTLDTLMTNYLMIHTPNGNVYASPMISSIEILRHFNTIAPVDIAVKKVSNSVASLPITLEELATGTHTELPQYELLRYPNNFNQKTLPDFLRDSTVFYALDGKVNWLCAGINTIRSIDILHPDLLHYMFDNDNTTLTEIHYNGTNPQIYRLDLSDGYYYNSTRTAFIHHVAQNSTLTRGKSGRSDITALRQEITLYLFTASHNLSLLSNGCRPSGAFILKAPNNMPATLSEEAFNRVKLQIQESYTGAGNAGRPLVLEGGLEWQEMGIKPKDMDFAAMRDMAEQKIYQGFGVPIQLIMDAKTTANNLQSFRLEFYENRVLPIADLFCAHLNKMLLQRANLHKKYQFKVNRDEVDVLTPRRIEKQKALEASTVYTINEKRAKLKLPPIQDGNKIVDPNGRPIAGEDAPVESQIAPVPTTPTPEPDPVGV